jgi:two-component system cell cycle sensor histidine kinase/response regulator CckA
MSESEAATILVVEDEPAVRALFAAAVRQEGYRVFEARNGAEALQVFDEIGGQIDLLVTDLRMPYLDGRTLASKLQARQPGLRMLFVSGYASDIQLGPNAALLQKPFARADLLHAIRNVLGRPVQQT